MAKTADRFGDRETYFEQYGLITLAAGAFAPFPEGYEILSVSSGVLGFDLRPYLLASLIGRGGRYFLEALLVLMFGGTAQQLSEGQLYTLLGVVSILVIAAYLLRRWWLPEGRTVTAK